MFNRIRTVFGINTALARLGINTQQLNPTWRQGCQEIALQQGLGPKAVAAYMYFQLPRHSRPPEGEAVIDRWIVEGELTRQEADYARLSAI